MAEKTITSANSIVLLSIIGLFAVPQKLEGYSADAAFDTDAVEHAEIVMGVDGNMSAGFTPAPYRQTFTIMPDSPSIEFFEAWNQAQKAAREVYFATGVIMLPSVNRTYAMTKGVLTSYKPLPDGRKVLQARPFIITWQDASPAPV